MFYYNRLVLLLIVSAVLLTRFVVVHSYAIQMNRGEKFCFNEDVDNSGVKDILDAKETGTLYTHVFSSGTNNEISVSVVGFHGGKVEYIVKDNLSPTTYLDGTYTFCITNKDFVNSKRVYFYFAPPLRIARENVPPQHLDGYMLYMVNRTDDSLKNLTAEMRNSRYKKFQSLLHAGKLHADVSLWSVVLMVTILITGVVQVLVLKNLFEQKSGVFKTMNVRT